MNSAQRCLAIGILTVTATLCGSGCAWNRVKINDPDAGVRADQVIPGKTKTADLVRIMGSEPNSVMPVKGDRQLYIYNFGDTKTKAFNLILIEIGKSNSRLDSAYFFIDPNGVVERKSVSRNSREVPWEWWAFGD